LLSTGTSLSISTLHNDYLMSGHREQDKQDVRDNNEDEKDWRRPPHEIHVANLRR
jgi:hypothetical protein